MEGTTQQLNIYQKLAKIRKPVEILQKDKAGYGYKYVTEALILAKITGLMDKLGVSLVPHIVAGTTTVAPYTYSKTKSTRDGKIYEEKVNEILVQSDMEWHWVNNDNPADRVVVPWAMVGQQADASQAFGSGLSYAARYFMLKYFNVATSDDDPDSWRTVQKEAEEQESKAVSAAIIAQVNEFVIAHLERRPGDRANILNIVRKYARVKGKPSENPNVITDPVAAANLLNELQEKYAD